MLPLILEPKRKAFRKGLDLLPRPDAGRRKWNIKREETAYEEQIL